MSVLAYQARWASDLLGIEFRVVGYLEPVNIPVAAFHEITANTGRVRAKGCSAHISNARYIVATCSSKAAICLAKGWAAGTAILRNLVGECIELSNAATRNQEVKLRSRYIATDIAYHNNHLFPNDAAVIATLAVIGELQ